MDATSADARRQLRGRDPRTREAKRARHQLVRELVAEQAVTSQQQLVTLLAGRGVTITQATASRDIEELGLVKVASEGRHVYAAPDDLAVVPQAGRDERLRRVLADYPVRVGRSGLTLVLVSESGAASAIGQAIDDSSLHEQEGTLAGDNTTLVLFADEDRLQAWLARFGALLPPPPAKDYRIERAGSERP